MLPLLEVSDFPPVRRERLETLQVNLGYRCNQRCLHCHVNASPERTEMMSSDLIRQIVPALKARGCEKLDLTGGAPEMHSDFRYLVKAARDAGVSVIDRCNLTILTEPDQQDLAEFLAANQVEIVASLPCYLEENVDAQRGNGVFHASLAGLAQLNKLGYGVAGSGLILNLVFNPQGAELPPSQEQLERDYKRELKRRFNIEFNNLFALSNVPINRFGSTLVSRGQFEPYMRLLKGQFSGAKLSAGNVQNDDQCRLAGRAIRL